MTTSSTASAGTTMSSNEGIYGLCLDIRLIRLLRSEIGTFESDRALEEFAADLCRQNSELSLLRETRDCERIRHMAHRLKGSAGYFGACALQLVAGDLEMIAADGNWSSMEPVLDRFQRAIDATAVSLERAGVAKE